MLEKVLIIHSGGIGDLLLALPAMRVFRRAYPLSTLELMGRPERLSLVSHDLGARSIHSIDRAGMAYFYLQDEVLPSDLSSFFSSFGTVLTFGKAGAETLAANLKKTGVRRVIDVPSFPAGEKKVHASDYLVHCLKQEGIEGEYTFQPLRLPAETLAWAGDFWASLGWRGGVRVLAIHPGSGSPTKNWGSVNFGRVADWASERAKVLLLSGPADGGVHEVRQAIRKSNPILLENIPLLQLAAILKSCTAYLGNDSGITHLAASLGIPTVALFGPTDPAVWGPKAPKGKILYPENSSPFGVSSEFCRPSLGGIKVDMVIEVLSPLFP